MGFHLFENPRLGFIFASLFILMDLAVVTYREQLDIHTRCFILAAEQEDAQTIIDLLSEDLQMAGGIRSRG